VFPAGRVLTDPNLGHPQPLNIPHDDIEIKQSKPIIINAFFFIIYTATGYCSKFRLKPDKNPAGIVKQLTVKTHYGAQCCSIGPSLSSTVIRYYPGELFPG
jgi:hypothetical protein